VTKPLPPLSSPPYSTTLVCRVSSLALHHRHLLPFADRDRV